MNLRFASLRITIRASKINVPDTSNQTNRHEFFLKYFYHHYSLKINAIKGGPEITIFLSFFFLRVRFYYHEKKWRHPSMCTSKALRLMKSATIKKT